MQLFLTFWQRGLHEKLDIPVELVRDRPTQHKFGTFKLYSQIPKTKSPTNIKK
jgi:hypothetical protein